MTSNKIDNIENRISQAGGSRVYLDFFHLKESPFSNTPDPEFLFLAQTHRNVIEKVLYSIDFRMGFILLSGEVGTGKTTICRSIIDTLNTKADTVYIINPSLSGKALIASILDDLGIPYAAGSSKKNLIDRLNHFLLSRDSSQPVVIIIDDAQTIPVEALEDLRLLSNLETDKEKMLQIVIVGQPELEDLLSRPEMRQLRQRISVNCRLEHLKTHEVESYIDRRLFIAGSNGQIQFSRGAKHLIAKKSRGIPRMINKICDYALTAGYVADEFVIRKKHVKRAFTELGGLESKSNFFFGKELNRTKIRVLASAMSFAVIFAVFVFPLLGKMYPLRGDSISRMSTGQSSSITNSNHSRKAHATSNTLIAKPGNLFEPSPTDSVPAIETDSNPSRTVLSLEQSSHKTNWTPAYYPFVIQIGLFKAFKNVAKAVADLTKKGLEVHWDSVDLGNKGKWIRIFAGHFESKATAQKVKSKYKLKDSLIRFNPWTVLVGQYSDVKILTSIRSRLRENRYDSHILKSAEGVNWLLTGAFPTKQEAENMVKELHKLSLSAKVVPR